MKIPLTSKNDIKIFILYLFESVGYPLDFETVNSIAIQDDIVKGFDFAECFAELVDAGHIREIKEGKLVFYDITETGSRVANELQSSLTAPIREKSLRSALRILSFQNKNAEISCKSNQREDGKFDLFCSITEKKAPVFELHMVVDSKERLERMKENFNERPEVVYKGLLALMAREVDYLFN